MDSDVSKGEDSAVVTVQPDNYDHGQAEKERIAYAQRQKEMREHAERMIAKDQLDPRQQWYLKNATTGKLIRKNEDYHRALENHHQVVQVTYSQALDLYRKEESAKKAALAKALAKKRAKRARKVNR